MNFTLDSRIVKDLTNEVYGNIFVIQYKESFLTALIILLSTLPQAILVFSLLCSELNQSLQRYSLLFAYFFSYSPQLLGFMLFVFTIISISVYKVEFYKTD